MMINDELDARRTVDAWLECALAGSRTEPEPSKRADVRHPWGEAMELLDGERIHYVQCKDISRSGIGILCRTELMPQDRVYLRRSEADAWVRCRVAHCTASVGRFRVGMELHFDFGLPR